LRRGLEVADEEFAEAAGVPTIFAVVVLQILSSAAPGKLLTPWGFSLSSLFGQQYGKAGPLALLALHRDGTGCSVYHSAFRFFKIFFANGSLISMCRGIASIAPFFGLIQRECEAPSLFK
jgi:hypothetical protein